jgi:hypothetical protein
MEYVFLVSAFVVAYFALLELAAAQGDSAFIKERRLNGDRKIVADFFLHNAWVRVLKATVMVIGALVCVILPPPADGMPMPAQSLILLFLWLFIGAGLVDLAIQARSARARLRRYSDTPTLRVPQGSAIDRIPEGRRSTDPPAA